MYWTEFRCHGCLWHWVFSPLSSCLADYTKHELDTLQYFPRYTPRVHWMTRNVPIISKGCILGALNKLTHSRTMQPLRNLESSISFLVFQRKPFFVPQFFDDLTGLFFDGTWVGLQKPGHVERFHASQLNLALSWLVGVGAYEWLTSYNKVHYSLKCLVKCIWIKPIGRTPVRIPPWKFKPCVWTEISS